MAACGSVLNERSCDNIDSLVISELRIMFLLEAVLIFEKNVRCGVCFCYIIQAKMVDTRADFMKPKFLPRKNVDSY